MREGTISGNIYFRDLETNLLDVVTDKDKIGTQILVRVFKQDTSWEATQADEGSAALTNNLLAEFRTNNLPLHNPVSFSISSSNFTTGATFDLGVSATAFNDWKVIPLTVPQAGEIHTNLTVAFTNLIKASRNLTAKVAFTLRDNVVHQWSQAEKQAIRDAIKIWERTTLVKFEEKALFWDVVFMWEHLGTFEAAGETDTSGTRVTFNLDWPLLLETVTKRRIKYHPGISTPCWDSPMQNALLFSTAVHVLGHVLGLRLTCGSSEECYEYLKDSDNQQFSVMSCCGQLGWLGYSDVVCLKKKITGKWLEFRAHCPVDILLTLPDGRIVSKATNSVPGATYAEEDVNGNGSANKVITLTNPTSGEYAISVVPQEGANPSEKVTLTVTDANKETVLLDAVAVSELPTHSLSVHVDRDPPQLSVRVGPSVITGADARMVPIAATLGVSDEDTNVVVALLDVVSSDGPDTNAVQGAEFETDDRSFQVQAAAGGPKRVYTVVYAASDSSGNVSQATADIVVIAQPGGVLLEAVQYDVIDGITIRILGEPGSTVRIQASSDLGAWTDLDTVGLPEGRAVFRDAASVANPCRYYRAVVR